MHVTGLFVKLLVSVLRYGLSAFRSQAVTLFKTKQKAMNKYYKKVLEVLKTNKDIKALGFSRKEVRGVAANVADKLNLKDEATDEEVSEAIDDAVDAVMPLLKLSQSVADRQVQSYKDAHPEKDADDPDDDDDNDDDDKPARTSPSKKGKKNTKDDNNDVNSALLASIKALTESVSGMKDEIALLKSGKVADSRRAKVEKLLKDTGKFGERMLKAYSRMTFKDDDEFDDYLDELKEDIEAVNQERADKGLEKLGVPPATNIKKKPGEKELMSDDEVKELAKM